MAVLVIGTAISHVRSTPCSTPCLVQQYTVQQVRSTPCSTPPTAQRTDGRADGRLRDLHVRDLHDGGARRLLVQPPKLVRRSFLPQH